MDQRCPRDYWKDAHHYGDAALGQGGGSEIKNSNNNKKQATTTKKQTINNPHFQGIMMTGFMKHHEYLALRVGGSEKLRDIKYY